MLAIRTWWSITLLLVVSIGAGQCVDRTLSASPDRLDLVKKRGMLVVGVRYDTPHYGWMNPKTRMVEGFEIDLARYIAGKIVGSPDKVEFRETNSASRIAMLKQGDVDIVLATMTVTAARREQIDFSAYYFPSGFAFMVPEKSTFSGDLQDVRGKINCAPQGSNAQEILLSVVTPKYGITANDTKVIYLPTNAECVEALRTGRADYMFTSRFEAEALAQMTPGVRVFPKTLLYTPWAAGIAKGNPGLVSAVSDAIKAAYNDGTWIALYRKWLHADPPTDWRPSN